MTYGTTSHDKAIRNRFNTLMEELDAQEVLMLITESFFDDAEMSDVADLIEERMHEPLNPMHIMEQAREITSDVDVDNLPHGYSVLQMNEAILDMDWCEANRILTYLNKQLKSYYENK